MPNGKIKELQSLAQTEFLNLYQATYENKNKEDKKWVIASRKDYKTLSGQYFNGKVEKLDAVVLIAFHEESKKLAVIKQFRVPLNDYVYELPAGLIDPDENIESTVKRELKEETGLTLVAIDYSKSRTKTYLSAGMTEESAALIYCTCTGDISSAYLEADEDIEALLLSKEEARAILESDAKIDIKAFMALQTFINDK